MLVGRVPTFLDEPFGIVTFTSLTVTRLPTLTASPPTMFAVSRDTECYRGIKPIAEGHSKPRIGSDDVTPNITLPLV